MGTRRGARPSGERGAAAVELGLVAGAIIVPLLLGVLQWGDYFWRAQRVDTITPGVGAGEVAGDFGCTALKDEVAAVVLDNVAAADAGLDLELSDITVTVVEVLPDVGVIVQIHLEVATDGLADLVPLPGGGSLVTDFSQRLEDVRVTDGVCR